MIVVWMLYAVIVGAAAALAASALDGAARVLDRPTRHVWTVALLFSVLWPTWRLASSMLGTSGQTTIDRAFLPGMVVTAGRSATDAIVQRLSGAGSIAAATALVLWCLTSALLGTRLLIGARTIARQRRTWTPRDVGGVRVLVAPDTGPAVVGLREPAIVFPEWALALDPGLQRLVLRHELEHVRAGDSRLRLLAALTTVLLPWNPVLWWQARRLTLAIEVDCDARVLGADPRRERYGLLLLAIAQRQSTAMLAPALSEPTSHLERRIRIMQRSASRRPTLAAAALAAVAAIALGAACAAPAPNASVAPSPEPGGVASTSTSPQRDAGYREFTLSTRAVPLAGNKAPRYPDAQRTAKTEGGVLAQFVVNPDGTVDMNTFKVLKASDPAFVAAVREALSRWRFEPAEVDGHKVRQLITEPFQFALSR